jgi:hypothetical protein
MHTHFDCISFGGYANSGGTVIRDVLSRNDAFNVLRTEFRIVKERYGFMDLYGVLSQQNMPETRDLAIKDFIWLCDNFARSSTFLGKSGLDYDLVSNQEFSNLVKYFICEITGHSYKSNWYFDDFGKSAFIQTINKIFHKINPKILSKDCFFVSMDSGSILNLIRKFNISFCQAINKKFRNNNILALHNAIPITSQHELELGLKMMPNIRVIIVDRDPRDIFLQMYEGRYLQNSNDWIRVADSFVKFFLSQRRDYEIVKAHNSVFFSNFESWCFQPNEMQNKLYKFLNLSNINGDNFGSFKAEISKNNIGLWRKCRADQAKIIGYIENELNGYISNEY